MSMWDGKIRGIFNKLSATSYFTEEEIEKILAEPEENWLRVWILVSMREVSVDLVSRAYPIKTLEDL